MVPHPDFHDFPKFSEFSFFDLSATPGGLDFQDFPKFFEFSFFGILATPGRPTTWSPTQIEILKIYIFFAFFKIVKNDKIFMFCSFSFFCIFEWGGTREVTGRLIDE